MHMFNTAQHKATEKYEIRLSARKDNMDGHSDKDDTEQRAMDSELGPALYKRVAYYANKKRTRL